jgi:hypothetical protein
MRKTATTAGARPETNAAHVGAEFTEKFRRGAVAAFPIAILMHLLFTYRMWPMSGAPSLWIAAILTTIGLAFRRIRRAVVVLAVGSVYFWFFLVYTIGVTPLMAYLVASHHRDWLPWAPLASTVLLLGFLFYRVRLTLLREWSRPLDQTQGVIVSREDMSVWRSSERPQIGLSRAAVVIMLVLGPTLYATYNTSVFLFILLVVATHSVAFLTTCVVAWWVAYYLVVRRWEKTSGLRLWLPALRPRVSGSQHASV